MATSLETARQEAPSAHALAEDFRRIIGHLRQHTGPLRTAAVGLVMAIGSCGLLLGGVTVAISSMLVVAGFDLLGAMTIGFFATGIIGMAVGLVLAVRAIRHLVRQYPSELTR